ncbi:MAG: hypothetical protein JOY96_06115 [Verrucomicrobia bacterium]|nr:hypothetical protein [Verrucomicrobiota bacterium]
MYRKNLAEVALLIALVLTVIFLPPNICAQTANSSPAPSRSPDSGLSALSGIPQSSIDSDATALELKLQQSIPEQNPIVFYGSSSIRLWKSLPEDFADYKVLNCGFGGSRLTDCIKYARQIVFPTRPSGVIIYAGDNDLAAGTPPEKAFQSFQKLFGILRSYSSSIPMAFVSVKPSPARLCYLDNILRFNQMVKAYLEGQPDSEYIDVCSEMLGPDRKPITSLFSGDRIHLSPAGYSIMRKEIGEFLQEEFPKQKHKTTVAR